MYYVIFLQFTNTTLTFVQHTIFSQLFFLSLFLFFGEETWWTCNLWRNVRTKENLKKVFPQREKREREREKKTPDRQRRKLSIQASNDKVSSFSSSLQFFLLFHFFFHRLREESSAKKAMTLRVMAQQAMFKPRNVSLFSFLLASIARIYTWNESKSQTEILKIKRRQCSRQMKGWSRVHSRGRIIKRNLKVTTWPCRWKVLADLASDRFVFSPWDVFLAEKKKFIKHTGGARRRRSADEARTKEIGGKNRFFRVNISEFSINN